MNKDNPLDIINDALQAYGGYQKTIGDSHMIICPYHDDARTPSLSVFIGEGMSIPIGFYHCLGCGAKGHWNKLADTIGGGHIKQWMNVEQGTSKILTLDMQRTLLDVEGLSLKSLLRTMNNPPVHPWPIHMEWRGYPGKLVKQVGGMMFEDLKTLNEESEPQLMLFFPVYVHGSVVGGVKAYMDKQPWRTSYLTTKGKWVGDTGLLFYDYAKRMMQRRGLRFVILVEGPRDALRLLKVGLPAIAVLGANTFSERKGNKIMALNPDKVYMMPDNDSGGATMVESIDAGMHSCLKPALIRLPEDEDENGELIKMDPDSAPPRLIRRIKQKLLERHG